MLHRALILSTAWYSLLRLNISILELDLWDGCADAETLLAKDPELILQIEKKKTPQTQKNLPKNQVGNYLNSSNVSCCHAV